MADETHKLQKDPPEGSRKVVEHELERQSGQAGDKPGAEKRRDGSAGSRDRNEQPPCSS